jgi:lysophospholipase L1-like esterase
MNAYRNAIFEVATSYGFNVVDGSQIGFPTEKGPFADLMCQDGVHPNQLGHEMYAKSLRGILL